MTDIEKACEAYDIAALIAARVIVKEGKAGEKTEVDIINDLRAPMKDYEEGFEDYERASSLAKTDWDKYKTNMEELIELAKRLAGQ